MVNKTISLSREVFDRLNQEPNASGLIDGLLRNHFESEANPKDKLAEIEKEIELKKSEEESLKKKIEENEKKREELVKRGFEEVEKNEYNSMDRWERTKGFMREAFNQYEIEKEKADELFNEFFNLLKEQKVNNLIEFMGIKGIKKKEKRHA